MSDMRYLEPPDIYPSDEHDENPCDDCEEGDCENCLYKLDA